LVQEAAEDAAYLLAGPEVGGAKDDVAPGLDESTRLVPYVL
jgi:hypothetical protein